MYEWGVSNFELGSGKISKIYDSIKRSDVDHSKIEAEKQEHQLIWGKRSPIGKEVGEYATSQMCSHCKHSIYALISHKDDGKKEYEILEGSNEKGVFVVGIETKKVYAYSDPKEPYQQGDKISGKDAIKHIREYQRPPVDALLKLDNLPAHIKQGLECKTRDINGKACYKQNQDGSFMKDKNNNLIKNKHGKKSEKPKMSEWEYTRGNSAIYRCAFTDCNKYSDADIQAAMWIALKRYVIKEKHVQELKNKDIKEQIQYVLKFATKHKIPAVDLSTER